MVGIPAHALTITHILVINDMGSLTVAMVTADYSGLRLSGYWLIKRLLLHLQYVYPKNVFDTTLASSRRP
jgi:hypothetical protein